MKGAQSEIADALDADRVGNTAGHQLGDGIGSGLSARSVVIGNIITDALRTAIGKAIDVGKEIAGGIYDGFSTNEQLVGGVEKIFDDMDTSKILDDASAAWENLNLSTNDYMDAIMKTGALFAANMGDEKAYEVAKTGMQAVSDYASGTGRDINELNDKFALITRSTGSYQSIADQFGGILPATSADFLAQAQAAGLLSDSYESLTDVPIAEYQQAVTDMMSKGVEEMGLMGNTADETFKTLSGSSEAMKASWENVLTAIGSGDSAQVKTAASGLVDSLFGAVNEETGAREGGVIENLLGLAQRSFEALGAALPGMLDMALNAMPPEIGGPLREAFESIGKVVETVAPIVSSAVGGIVTAVGQIAPVVAPLLPIIAGVMGAVKIAGVITTIVGAISGFITTAGAAIGMISGIPALISAIVTIMGGPITIIAAIVGAIVAFLATNEEARAKVLEVWNNIKTAVTNAVTGAIDFLTNAWNTASSTVATVMGNIKDTISKTWNTVKSTVASVVGGIVSTISGKLSGIASRVRGIFNSVKKGITDPINTAKSLISSAIGKIKSIIGGVKLQLPHINLPHFSVSGGKAPWGIGGKGSLPSFSVSWYAKGGYFDEPTIFAGVGERGGEFVWPSYAPYLDRYADALSERMGGAGGVNVYLTYNGSGDADELVSTLTRDLRMMRMTGAI